MRQVAGAVPLGNLASAIAVRAEEASLVAELKAGSEEAYAWLIGQYHQPIYNLVYRVLNDPCDAADTTQEVFLKVFRGMKRFHGESSLKTWMYRIAIHEAANRRRWWFRHKSRETTIEAESPEAGAIGLKDTLVDVTPSPFDDLAQAEVRERVERELRCVPEPYRTAVVLRDIEDLSYEEIAEVLDVSLGTVKSRLMRGRQALKKRLESYVREVGQEMGMGSTSPSGSRERLGASEVGIEVEA